MPKDETYKLGDIIRWKNTSATDEYNYGMVLAEPQVVTCGTYTFSEQISGILDYDVDTFKMANPLYSVTLFSFAQQKVVTLYRSPEDVPLFLEKVTFIRKN